MDSQQQQQFSLVSGLPPPPPTASSSASTSLGQAQICTTAMSNALNSSGEYVNVPSSYVTIGMLPQQGSAANANVSMASNISTPISSTSTFKTPLLPMPTLEDIEVGLMGPQASGMPQGILKYPATSSSIPPQGIGPGPPNVVSSNGNPPLSHIPSHGEVTGHNMSIPPPPSNISLGPNAPAPPPPAASSSSLVDASTCGTLKSSAKLQTPANLCTSTTATSGLIGPPMGGGGAAIAVSSSNNINTPSSSTVPLNLHSTTANSSKTSSRSNLHQRPPASPKCCSCFGSSNSSSSMQRGRGSSNKSSSSMSMKSNVGHTYTHKSNSKGHRRHNVQTFWSALLTNLGICALLLAYTLLGKHTNSLLNNCQWLPVTPDNSADDEQDNNNDAVVSSTA
uniref:Uncharacterized protein n=1 Tax=Musca domestica TaxID=7370 RepID=A0A1I8NAK4_MUSDO